MNKHIQKHMGEVQGLYGCCSRIKKGMEVLWEGKKEVAPFFGALKRRGGQGPR